MARKLDAAARDAALGTLDGWSLAGDREAIVKSFRFDDFKSAFGFMGLIAVYADVVDHHPEWFNIYGRVDVTLASHDVDGISERDVAMARFMDRAARKAAAKNA